MTSDVEPNQDAARTVAAEMKASVEQLSPDLRARFIAVRTALYRRGVFDPVLARFDSATVARATNVEVAEHLEAAAPALA